MKFSALNLDLSSPSPDSLSSRRLGHAGGRQRRVPTKMVILPLLSCVP